MTLPLSNSRNSGDRNLTGFASFFGRVAALENPRSIGQALQGSELGELWRYRVGDYRVVCDLQNKRLVVLVVRVAHRREVYR